MKIITGMHRSGTSMIANLVAELGGDLGPEENLLEADQWNQRGYFENREIFIFNDHILLGDHIPTRQFWTTRPEDRGRLLRLVMTLARVQYMIMLPFQRRLTRRIQARQDDIRQREALYGHLYSKDPRFSLLIAEWAKIVPVEKVLYCYRHPYEVAHSLRNRGNSPMAAGYFLWNFHVERFLRGVEGLPLVVVNYNHFFDAGRRLDEMRRLFHYLGRPYDEEEAQAVVERVMDQKLKQHDYAGQPIPAGTGRLLDALHNYHRVHDDLCVAGSIETYQKDA